MLNKEIRKWPVVKVMYNGNVFGYFIDIRTANMYIPPELKYKIFYTIEVINDKEHTKLFNEILEKGKILVR